MKPIFQILNSVLDVMTYVFYLVLDKSCQSEFDEDIIKIYKPVKEIEVSTFRIEAS